MLIIIIFCFICIFLVCLFPRYTKQYKITMEYFEQPKDSFKKPKENLKQSEEHFEQRCKFQADSGLVCPFVHEDDEYIIKPYQDVPANIQKEVVEKLDKEFGDYSHKFINKTWNNSDVFYVLIVDDKLIGTVAVDRKNFYPVISQLFVVSNYRNKGYASKLLDFAENYIRSMKFSVAKLWCEPDLIKFYQKRGYEIEDTMKKQVIMIKNL